MFHRASFRLAARYLSVIMAISLFFSLNVYELSVQELDRGLRHPGPVAGLPPGVTIPSTLLQQLQTNREHEYQQARIHVLQRLVLVNLLILAGAGFLSYYLARRTLQPIEEAHEAQSRFTADASHELRTPIAAMQTEIEVALMDHRLALPQAKALLRSNLEELAKLTALSEGLLRLARMENGDLPLEPVALDDAVQAAVACVLPLAEKKHILINAGEPAGLVVPGDSQSLTELLVILLDNAIKYSPPKTEIQVSASRERRQALVRVTDSGAGIRASELPHIFERFYRSDAARSKQSEQGYGLGLAIARNIAGAHRGSLTASSKPGQGSTFTLALPVR